jgi:hypothetical protein
LDSSKPAGAVKIWITEKRQGDTLIQVSALSSSALADFEVLIFLGLNSICRDIYVSDYKLAFRARPDKGDAAFPADYDDLAVAAYVADALAVEVDDLAYIETSLLILCVAMVGI